MAEPKERNVLNLKKYANRRYYDAEHSRHLKLQEIHQLVKSGQSIRVADGQTGKDITSEVLLGILLEFEPEKAAAVPESMLNWWIRAETAKLRELAQDSAEPFLKALADMRKQFETKIKGSPAMQEIIPAVNELAKEMATPFKKTSHGHQPASPESENSAPQKSANEDLEELIRAYDAGEFKSTQ